MPLAETLLPIATALELLAEAFGPMAMASAALLVLAPSLSALAVNVSLDVLIEKYLVLEAVILLSTFLIFVSIASCV